MRFGPICNLSEGSYNPWYAFQEAGNGQQPIPAHTPALRLGNMVHLNLYGPRSDVLIFGYALSCTLDWEIHPLTDR